MSERSLSHLPTNPALSPHLSVRNELRLTNTVGAHLSDHFMFISSLADIWVLCARHTHRIPYFIPSPRQLCEALASCVRLYFLEVEEGKKGWREGRREERRMKRRDEGRGPARLYMFTCGFSKTPQERSYMQPTQNHQC